MTSTDWDSSAEAYRRQASKIGFLVAASQRLVESAHLRAGTVLVDLACGTGLTTRAALVCGEPCTVYAVDRSPAMLRLAGREIADEHVHCILAMAEDFARYVPQPVDRVLCSAAFHYFGDPEAVLCEVRRVLKPKGRFLFNIPDDRFDFGDRKPSELTQLLTDRLGVPRPDGSAGYSQARIQTLASASGLCVAGFSKVQIALRPEDLLRLGAVPHVAARWLPEVPAGDRPKLIEKALSSLTPKDMPIYHWAQFVLAPTV